MKFIIKNSKGTYYKGMTGIGPQFGATDEEAMKFDDIVSANQEMLKHSFAFFDCEVEGYDSFN